MRRPEVEQGILGGLALRLRLHRRALRRFTPLRSVQNDYKREFGKMGGWGQPVLAPVRACASPCLRLPLSLLLEKLSRLNVKIVPFRDYLSLIKSTIMLVLDPSIRRETFERVSYPCGRPLPQAPSGAVRFRSVRGYHSIAMWSGYWPLGDAAGGISSLFFNNQLFIKYLQCG